MLYYTQDFAAQYVDEFDELPFDPHRLKSHVERLVMASAPWQSWMMHVRRVFRWEDPVETGRWLMLYIVLWYTQNLVAFVVCIFSHCNPKYDLTVSSGPTLSTWSFTTDTIRRR